MKSSDAPGSPVPSSAEDQLLESRVRRVLASSVYAVLRRIRVSARGGCVYLEGCVPSYYFKQMAQVIALRAVGVTWICNELVVPEDSAQSPVSLTHQG